MILTSFVVSHIIILEIVVQTCKKINFKEDKTIILLPSVWCSNQLLKPICHLLLKDKVSIQQEGKKAQGKKKKKTVCNIKFKDSSNPYRRRSF